ncbi:hypothetical protein [Gelidibacter maritimus]|uniref:Uncharacterized protein n=1 Tax=Gelidibacter maritimus TaxID=2761487 RepID=A0A7W2M267_9FLAO|nr:hypothetical protein [Gelidibacter maritimus]MBA6151265.1 hypothetical protein [Gelidibacter maritimus]
MKKSQLHNIKETGFTIPDSYFDSFEKRLMDKMAVQDEMATIKDPGYTVPENYFEAFDTHLQARLSADGESSAKSKIVPLISWRSAMVISGVAATLLLLFTLVLKSDDPLSINQVETASIEAYLNNENLNDYDIASYLDDDELNIDNFVSTTLTEESLENYLLNHTSLEDLIFGK